MLSVVVLPAPFSPIRPVMAPSAAESEMPESALTAPNRMCRSRTSIIEILLSLQRAQGDPEPPRGVDGGSPMPRRFLTGRSARRRLSDGRRRHDHDDGGEARRLRTELRVGVPL